jgi:myosin heavy subunit
LYIFYIFKSEEKEFKSEGLEKYLSELVFTDNQPIIDLMDKPTVPVGIFSLLDESCSVGNQTDEGLLSKIVSTHKDKSKFFDQPRMSRELFIVKHSAKDVAYNVIGFRFKNRDELNPNIEETIIGSSFQLVTNVFRGICSKKDEEEVQNEKKVLNIKDKFLGAKFKI